MTVEHQSTLETGIQPVYIDGGRQVKEALCGKPRRGVETAVSENVSTVTRRACHSDACLAVCALPPGCKALRRRTAMWQMCQAGFG